MDPIVRNAAYSHPYDDRQAANLSLDPSSAYVNNSGHQNAPNHYQTQMHQTGNLDSGLMANHLVGGSVPAIHKPHRKDSSRSGKDSTYQDQKGVIYAAASSSYSSSPSKHPSHDITSIGTGRGSSRGVLESFMQALSRQPPHKPESTHNGSSLKKDGRRRESSVGKKAHKVTMSGRRSDQKKGSHSTESPETFSERAPDTRRQQPYPVESSVAKANGKDLRQPTTAAQPQQHSHQVNPSVHRKDGQRSSCVIDDKPIFEEPETYYRSNDQGQGRQDQQQFDSDQYIRASADEVENITRKYYKYKQQAAELDEEVSILQNENDTLRDLLSKEAASKNLMGGMGAGKCHLQDSDIYQQWKQLGWWIRQCVHVASDASKQKYAADGGATPRSHREVDDHKEKLKKRSSRSKSKSRRDMTERESHGGGHMDALITVTPYYEAFLDTDKQRSALAEAAIWKTLLEKGIFTTSSNISRMEWAGRYAHSIRPMRKSMTKECNGRSRIAS